MGTVAHIEEGKKQVSKDVHWLSNLVVCLTEKSYGGVLDQNGSESSLVAEVKEIQDSHYILLDLNCTVH